MGRKALITSEIETILAAQMINRRTHLIKDKLRTKDASQLLDRMVKAGTLPKDTKLPGPSALQKGIAEVFAKLKAAAKSPLDEPWSIGACIKYPSSFPPESIDMLLEFQRHRTHCAVGMTVREARWIVMLRPLLLKKKPAHKTDKQWDGFLSIIASQYARVEEITDIFKRPYPNTSIFDNPYFIEGKVDSKTLLENEIIKWELGGLKSEVKDNEIKSRRKERTK